MQYHNDDTIIWNGKVGLVRNVYTSITNEQILEVQRVGNNILNTQLVKAQFVSLATITDLLEYAKNTLLLTCNEIASCGDLPELHTLIAKVQAVLE